MRNAPSRAGWLGAALVAVVVALACEGRPPLSLGTSPDAGPTGLAAYRGIYSLVEATLNQTSCEAEGPSVLSSQANRLFFAEQDVTVPRDSLVLAACRDPADCRSRAEPVRTGRTYTAAWVYAVSAPGPGGAGVTINRATPEGGACRRETIERASLTGPPRGAVRIEVRITAVPDHPVDADGKCTGAATESAAAGRACSQLLVFRGQFREAL
jgi:hypothetical protein